MLSAVDIFNRQENQNGSFLQSKRYWFQALTVEESGTESGTGRNLALSSSGLGFN